MARYLDDLIAGYFEGITQASNGDNPRQGERPAGARATPWRRGRRLGIAAIRLARSNGRAIDDLPEVEGPDGIPLS